MAELGNLKKATAKLSIERYSSTVKISEPNPQM
jgi:hypothetical protein